MSLSRLSSHLIIKARPLTALFSAKKTLRQSSLFGRRVYDMVSFFVLNKNLGILDI